MTFKYLFFFLMEDDGEQNTKNVSFSTREEYLASTNKYLNKNTF